MQTYMINNLSNHTFTDLHNNVIDCSLISIDANSEYEALAVLHRQYLSEYNQSCIFTYFEAIPK